MNEHNIICSILIYCTSGWDMSSRLAWRLSLAKKPVRRKGLCHCWYFTIQSPTSNPHVNWLTVLLVNSSVVSSLNRSRCEVGVTFDPCLLACLSCLFTLLIGTQEFGLNIKVLECASVEALLFIANITYNIEMKNLAGTWMAFLDLFWRHKAWLSSLCDVNHVPGYALLPEVGCG